METPFEKPPITEKKETPIQKLIIERRALEQRANLAGTLSFEASRSNSGLIADKPEVVVSDPEKTDEDILEMGREADRIVCDGLRQELERNGLQPDGKTFYLLDFGLPHLPALQSVLLDHGIDPSIYTNPSEQTLRDNAGHFRRYVSVYREHAEELFTKRERLEQPKGLALLVNSHAEADERADIATILPSVELLRQKGITKLVLGKEIFYHYGAPDPKNPTWQGFFEASEVNKYAKQLSEVGIEVVVIGFDYRYKEKEKEQPQSIKFDEFDPSYRPQAIEVYDSSVCQSLSGKRMVFDRKSGRIYKIINGFEKSVSESEIVDFSRNLLDAGLSDEEIERMKKNLPPSSTKPSEPAKAG
ncbi:MAG: hypothetical protein AAB863_01330 [Patescibacteria group bacterium]